MNIEMLRKYKNWEGKSPEEILNWVKGVGGWQRVFDSVAFPGGLPLWAHRVRNYFNLEPRFLICQDKHNTELLLGHILRKYNWINFKSDEMLIIASLSRNVYREPLDNNRDRVWFQMDPGATIYHWGKEPTNPEKEGAAMSALGQRNTPVFKLFSRDATDSGSCETIIENPIVQKSMSMVVGNVTQAVKGLRASNIGSVDMAEFVAGRIVKDTWYQGSYNYAETVLVGKDVHDKYDVEPHTKNKFPEVYVNPPDRHSPLSTRKFPETGPGEKKPLAEQIKNINETW